MSLGRLALRLATLEALRPTAALSGGPLPTSAGTLVFDSRIDPIDDLSVEEQKLIIVVYTDDDNGDPAQKAGGPPYKRTVDLVCEISAVVRARGAVADDYVVGTPETDAELEASLDLMEAQIRFALEIGPTGALWRKLTGRRVTDINSHPRRTSEEGVRLAMRTLRMKVTLDDDVYLAAPAADPTGLNRLVEPLKSVIDALASTSYGAKIAAGLAADVPAMPVRTPLETVTLDMQPSDPPAPYDPAKPQVNAAADNLQG